MSARGSSKCPPFCPKQCSNNHHELLSTLIRVQNNNVTSLKQFKQAVSNYESSIKPQDSIPDANKDYRYPLLHWATVLGKTSAVKYLLDHGHPADVKSSLKGETALHRLIRCFYKTFTWSRPSRKNIIDTLQKLIDLLSSILFVADDNRNTPLHACAIYITELKEEAEMLFFVDLYDIIMKKALTIKQSKNSKTRLINQPNKEGNSLWHIFSSCDSEQCVNIVEKLLEIGTVSQIKNLEGKTAFDIAEETSIKISRLYVGARKRRRSSDDGFSLGSTPDSSPEVTQNDRCNTSAISHGSISLRSNHVNGLGNGNIGVSSLSTLAKGSKKRKSVPRPVIMPTFVTYPSVKMEMDCGILNTTQEEELHPTSRNHSLNANGSVSGKTENNNNIQPDLASLLKKVGKEKVVMESVLKSKEQLQTDLQESKSKCVDLIKTKESIDVKSKEISEDIKIKQKELLQLQDSFSVHESTIKTLDEKLLQEKTLQTQLSSEIGVYNDILKCLNID
eukprot:gene17070-18790_t